ncbi:outer membrane protein assembly factor BamD [Porphyromonas endodontalis]|uniref:outer membrane protein assembly factor BamD n=1 Tax=Porphyromonas endodontalis TaxID=28124 RepID=UPI00248D3B3F|nr:outer membrane protein assembly factor BamD [Porphyromonas endodontalis]
MTKDKIVKLLATGGLVLFSLLISSCGEMARIQKSNDTSLKYDYAKKYFNQKKWSKASELLVDVVPAYEGTSEGAQALYMLGISELALEHGDIAAESFRRYYTNYPKGAKAEESRFRAGEAFYISSPEAQLDQNVTYTAIQELQTFIELYPTSDYRKDAERMLFDLQDKLAYKELKSATLYYDMGMYLGNNYQSAVVTANNALKDYPYSKWREDFYILILRATYQEAINSVVSKQQERYRNVIDRYFAYVNEFPQGKYTKEADRIYKRIQPLLSEEA